MTPLLLVLVMIQGAEYLSETLKTSNESLSILGVLEPSEKVIFKMVNGYFKLKMMVELAESAPVYGILPSIIND